LKIKTEIINNGGKAEIFGGDLADLSTIKNLIKFAEETRGD
jgi:hypothetical protein